MGFQFACGVSNGDAGGSSGVATLLHQSVRVL